MNPIHSIFASEENCPTPAPSAKKTPVFVEDGSSTKYREYAMDHNINAQSLNDLTVWLVQHVVTRAPLRMLGMRNLFLLPYQSQNRFIV